MRPFTEEEARELIEDWFMLDPAAHIQGDGEYQALLIGRNPEDVVDTVNTFSIERGINVAPDSFEAIEDGLDDPPCPATTLILRTQP